MTSKANQCWLLRLVVFLAPLSAMAFPGIRPWWDVSGSAAFEQKIDVNGDGIQDLALISQDTWVGNPLRVSVEHQYQFHLRTLGETKVLFANPPGTSAKLFRHGEMFAADSAFDEEWRSGQLTLGEVSGYSTLSPTGPIEVETDSTPWRDSDGCLGVKVSGIGGTQVGWVFFSRHLAELWNRNDAQKIVSGAAAPDAMAFAQISRFSLSLSAAQELDLDSDGFADVVIERRWKGADDGPPSAVFLRTKPHCEFMETITDPPNWNWVPGTPLFEVNPPPMGWADVSQYRQRILPNSGFTQRWMPRGSILFARLTDPDGKVMGPATKGENFYLTFKLPGSTRSSTLGWLELTAGGSVIRYAAASGGLTFTGDTVPLESLHGPENYTSALFDFNYDGLVDLQCFSPGTPYPAPWQPDIPWNGGMWRLLEPGMTCSRGDWGGQLAASLLKGTLIRPCGIPHPEFGEQPNGIGQTVFAMGYMPLWIQLPDGCHVGWYHASGTYFIQPEPDRAVMSGYQDDDTEQPRLQMALTGDKVKFAWPSHFIGFELQGMPLSQANPRWYRIEGTSAGIGMNFQSNQVSVPRTSATLNGQWIFRAYRPKIVPQ